MIHTTESLMFDRMVTVAIGRLTEGCKVRGTGPEPTEHDARVVRLAIEFAALHYCARLARFTCTVRGIPQ